METTAENDQGNAARDGIAGAAAGLFGDISPLSVLECTISQQDLAAACEVTRQTIAGWFSGLRENGGYRLSAVLRAFAAARTARAPRGGRSSASAAGMAADGGAAAGTAPADGDTADSASQDEKRAVEIQKLKLQIAQLNDKLIPRRETEEQMAIAAAILTRRLAALGKKHGGDLPGEIDQALAECRAEIAAAFTGGAADV